jgi:hypothetical protein
LALSGRLHAAKVSITSPLRCNTVTPCSNAFFFNPSWIVQFELREQLETGGLTWNKQSHLIFPNNKFGKLGSRSKPIKVRLALMVKAF